MSDFGIGTNKAFRQNGVLLEIISLLNPLLRTETRTTSSDIQWETDISEVIYIWFYDTTFGLQRFHAAEETFLMLHNDQKS